MVREAEGDWLREVPLEAEGDCRGEGGSVFKSGAIGCGGVSDENQYPRQERMRCRTACDGSSFAVANVVS